jgi:hypothetical protein
LIETTELNNGVDVLFYSRLGLGTKPNLVGGSVALVSSNYLEDSHIQVEAGFI